MQQSVFIGIAGLIVGAAIGFFGANALNRNAAPATQSASVQPANSATVPTGPEMLADVSDMLKKAENEPQNFATQMRAGDMYARIGKFDQAIEFYKKGIVLKPEDFNANVVIANAYFDSGQYELAGDHYAKALSINPKSTDARSDLGTTFVERKTPDYDRAITEFKSVLETEPNHAPSLYYLGIAYFRKGDAPQAEQTLAKLQQTNPNSDLIERLRQNLNPPQAQ